MSQDGVEFHTLDADTVDDVVRLFIRKDQGELIGDLLKFPGFQAIATVRKQSGVFTLQISPSTQPLKL